MLNRLVCQSDVGCLPLRRGIPIGIIGLANRSHFEPCPEAPDVFRALRQPGFETPKHRFPGCVMEGSEPLGAQKEIYPQN